MSSIDIPSLNDSREEARKPVKGMLRSPVMFYPPYLIAAGKIAKEDGWIEYYDGEKWILITEDKINKNTTNT